MIILYRNYYRALAQEPRIFTRYSILADSRNFTFVSDDVISYLFKKANSFIESKTFLAMLDLLDDIGNYTMDNCVPYIVYSLET